MTNRKLWIFALVLIMAVSAVSALDLPNPYKNAKEGDWVVHEMKGGMQMRQTVVAVSPDTVTIEIQTIMNGNVVHKQTMDQERNSKPDLKALGVKEGGPEPKISEDTLTIKGKKIKCTLIVTEKDDITTKIWLSEEIPVNGLVKTEMTGKEAAMSGVMVVTDWGRGK